MVVTFYGVRGSVPAPGRNTVKYGGNTSCVHVHLNNGCELVLDAGTGIRGLGKRLIQQANPIYVLVSHRHWDHIQGFPFFSPIYQAGRHIQIYSGVEDQRQLISILGQMDGATFPVPATRLPSRVEALGHRDIRKSLESRGIRLDTKRLNHPGGGLAFRVEEDGLSIAYVTDNELEPPGNPTTRYDQWVEFCRGVDLLIHDAQYREADMPHKHGWGHSVLPQVRQLSVDAEARNLAMFHHDPDRSDAELADIERENEAFFRSKGLPSRSIVTFEGLQLKLTKNGGPGGNHGLDVL